uniref:Uncharacterized protein n=1 Tax=Pipistrellus kuhlii TaxID=59472 RepID=A0A7J7XVH2_PIPKU|nr:hypothetical protein mPipKuh1_010485 [Pipistrellus kuhlii]
MTHELGSPSSLWVDLLLTSQIFLHLPPVPSAPRALLSNLGIAKEKQVPPATIHAAKQSLSHYFHSPPPDGREVDAVLCNVSLGREGNSVSSPTSRLISISLLGHAGLSRQVGRSLQNFSRLTICLLWHSPGSPFPNHGTWVLGRLAKSFGSIFRCMDG